MCLWQVYAFLNQVLLQRFEIFSLIANYSHLYELLFIGLEPRMLPWQQDLIIILYFFISFIYLLTSILFMPIIPELQHI